MCPMYPKLMNRGRRSRNPVNNAAVTITHRHGNGNVARISSGIADPIVRHAIRIPKA